MLTFLRLAAECIATIVSFLAFAMAAVVLAATLKG
jgi:hypothetical protein